MLIRIDVLAAEHGRGESNWINVRSIKKDGDELVILFSGILETPGIPEIRYNPAAGTATVRADGWELPVQVEPFATAPAE